jgi:hypothetical protein
MAGRGGSRRSVVYQPLAGLLRHYVGAGSRPVTGGPAEPLSRLLHAITLGDEEKHSMAHHYAIRTFDETAPVVLGGATAAYESAGNTLATVVPPDWRLIQLLETGRKTELDAVTVSFAALLQEV